jgi:predicted metal-dependent hydrolase
LADVAALEHFTAMLGQWVLQNRGLDYAGTDPVMLDLLRWHGAEEVEHRSLVFDVYQHVCGNYFIRAFSMFMTAPLFIGWWVAGAKYLMAQDPTIDEKWRLRDWWRAARQYKLPGPWQLLVTTPVRYMRPGHHPGPEAVTEMAIEYLEYSPAAKAARQRALSQGKAQVG